jgi:Zn finger protein HypA/HybF involved in hydrogenase expression
MMKYICKCNDCQAKFEVVIEGRENIICPSCESKNLTIISEEAVEASGCGGCEGCAGCH